MVNTESFLVDGDFAAWRILHDVLTYAVESGAFGDGSLQERLMDAFIACEIERLLQERNQRMTQGEQILGYEDEQTAWLRPRLAGRLRGIIEDIVGPLALLASSEAHAPADGVLGKHLQQCIDLQFGEDGGQDETAILAQALGLVEQAASASIAG